MPFVGVTDVTGSGDIGANLISRIHWRKSDGSAPSATDGGNAAAAIYLLYNGSKGHMPASITWTIQQTFTVIDEDSGGLVGYFAASNIIPPIQGGEAAAHAAGLGARVEYKTTTLAKVRLMKGATFLVPTSTLSYDTTGALTTIVVQDISAAALAMRNSFTSTGLQLIVYHRPPKGVTTGGKHAVVTAHVVKNTPAGLRSRRI